MDPVESTLLYHRLSGNGVLLEPADLAAFSRYRDGIDFTPLDPATRPPPFKPPGASEPVELPRGLRAAGGAFEAQSLARLLHLSAGITRTRVNEAGALAYFRASMSAGNLHPLELYVVCGALEGLDPGVYHFSPLEFRLERLRATDERGFLQVACATEAGRAPAAALVITGIPWRTAWKYGERGWRHLYWDTGTMLANLLAAAAGAGVTSRLLAAFVDADVARLVGADGADEFPLAVVELGQDGAPAAKPAPPTALSPASPLSYPRLPLIIEAQRAGDLGSRGEVRTCRATGVDVEGGGTPAGDDARLDEVILLRSATRRMRHEEAPKHLLDDALAAATGRPALSHYVNVHDVTGVDPGAYAVRPHGLELVRPGDHRAESRRLCLDQRLGGDAAFTIFHTTELGELLRTHGARGYRVANLEAGLASGRVALAAFALGYGATALTFLDDDVAVFLGRPVTCLLVTAVGIPAAPVRPGALPGEFAAF